jgi:hypothetical protein
MWALIFSKLLSEMFLILRIIQRDIVIKVYRSSYNVPLSDFNETYIVSTEFLKILQCQIS